jgi:uncharacterized protein YutE (UPF0331/DUF86 family)
VDRGLVEEKLEALRRCVARIAAKRPPTAAVLAANPDLQDIIALNLTRAVPLCVDIAAHLIADSDEPAPATMGEAFDRLVTMRILEPELAGQLRKAAGFRNIAVHNYLAIDWTIVHDIAHTYVGDFERFAARVAKAL